MGSAGEWTKRDAAVVWHGFTQMACYTENAPVIVESAEGHELIDVDGRRYLDAISSLWVTTLGHRVPALDQAARDQLDRVAHSTMLGHGNRAAIELAEALAQVVPVDGPHFLFASDGAAAVEQALKIAFQYWVNRGVDGRTTYLAFGGAYHGDTVGGLSVGAGGFGIEMFDPLRFPVRRAPGFDEPRCFEVASRLVAEHADELAAVVVEPLVQGAAGMITMPPGFLKDVERLCREHDVLLLADEVATGFGRTGAMFACEHEGVEPDLMAIGKGLTGGYLPVAATLTSDAIYDAFSGEWAELKALYHGHSFTGNQLGCAAALASLDLFERDRLVERVCESSELVAAGLRELAALPHVGEVRQRGLMVGIELVADRGTKEPFEWSDATGLRVCRRARELGMLTRPLGDVVTFLPPLASEPEDLAAMLAILRESIAGVTGA